MGGGTVSELEVISDLDFKGENSPAPRRPIYMLLFGKKKGFCAQTEPLAQFVCVRRVGWCSAEREEEKSEGTHFLQHE